MSIGNRKVGITIYLEIKDAAFLDEERGETKLAEHLRNILSDYVKSKKSKGIKTLDKFAGVEINGN